MKTFYWDTSALIDVILGGTAAAAFDQAHQRLTRAHTLAETFSQLTGGTLRSDGQPFRIDAGDAAEIIAQHAGRMKVVSLSSAETLVALRDARRHGVRGGAVHDYLHVVAAELNDADRIYTLDSDLSRFSNIPAIAP